MIIEQYKFKTQANGHVMRFKTDLFGKVYYWMTDPEGEWYLARIAEDGTPKVI